MTILYFTATGNSLYVAKKLGGTLYSVTQQLELKNFVFKDDKIGIIFPVYGLSISHYIENFISKCTFDTNYLFAIMTFGQYTGAATGRLNEIANKYGIEFSYINSIKMVDNWLPGYRMEDQLLSIGKKDVKGQLEKITADISSEVCWQKKDNLFDRFTTSLLENMNSSKKKKVRYHTEGLRVSDYFYIDDSCIGCSICTKVCPVKNVELHNSEPSFAGECISCLACVQNCPKKAIRIRGEKSHERYRNSEISLQEIVESNNRTDK
ncbi:MAG: EFR1 family ferrodoxin [Sphaerochaeta sp.]